MHFLAHPLVPTRRCVSEMGKMLHFASFKKAEILMYGRVLYDLKKFGRPRHQNFWEL